MMDDIGSDIPKITFNKGRGGCPFIEPLSYSNIYYFVTKITILVGNQLKNLPGRR
jgi:hypothetical protein